MIQKINHIGIVVKDIEQAVSRYTLLGLKFSHLEISEEFKVKVGFFHCGEVFIELVEPMCSGDAMDFLEQHGEGIHHICYEVDDIDEQLAEARPHFTLRQQAPAPGANNTRVFFVEPDGLCGVLTEFAQLPRAER